ncbi:3-oxoacyl-[acyl-carrier-protein] synthase I,chloroplastic [Waddlia chondrophila 2032/99]|uniref:3-oxoacyl-[acyl-carrier-protein] synthase 2 n=2 Tax=Waddlia chondrophila TaxID=71667 RepID=D6YRN0_WADCW|nr:beta-ketoacyl-ACP synthase II [Waddlia chondrophila]ADI38725.1 3-oxoacyl-[acyl-carrier-protein] synthase II [Waddlia chondrophila WSU 86-1044]CCB92260.1 3-oxoacyl-[acyl-carrier-protein] synthase I,chloroplastic [Waddlia chondrophila 2032/99]
MTKRTRIVVTGLGIVSCHGDDVDAFYRQLLEGKSGISTITGFSTEDLATTFAGEIRDFDPGKYMDKKQARRVDKCIAYTMVAGKKALESAGLNEEALNQVDLEKCGAIIGSGMGGMGVFVDGVQSMSKQGPKRVTPFFIPYILTNMGGALFAMDLGFMGPNYSISTACATGNHSIAAAANHIRLGDADVMVCGGVEAAILPMGIAGFNACKALSKRNDAPEKASRPWDKERDGFVMGEGAGILVLERLEHALERGASIVAEYMGHGISCDAHHMTEPRPDGKGIAKCMLSALKDAGLKPEEISYINAHATSTPAGDMVEVNALKQVIPDPSKVVMNATKSMIGHGLGAAAGIEAVVTAKAIQEGKVHPTINLENPEPDLGFHTPTEALEMEVKVAVSNSFGFGGHNSSIILGKYKE